MKNMLFILNPMSGQRHARLFLYEVLNIFNKAGYLVTVCYTQCRGHATEIAREKSALYDIVVCCGGDGTLNETVSGLLQSPRRVPLGYIPAGSTNDFAVSLGIPKAPLKAAESIVGGTEHGHDIGLFNDEKNFTYVASFGAFTETSYATAQSLKNVLGHMAYMLEGAKSVSKIRAIPLEVAYDDGSASGEFLFGAVANSTSMGGVVKLRDPLIDFDDGLFEIMLIRNPKTVLELNGIINCMLKYEYDERYVSLVRSSFAEFRFKEPVDWSLDGEYCAGGTQSRIDNLHGVVKLVY